MPRLEGKMCRLEDRKEKKRKKRTVSVIQNSRQKHETIYLQEISIKIYLHG